MTRVTCPWCHELTAAPTCPACGHRADVPRLACDCPECSLRAVATALSAADHEDDMARGLDWADPPGAADRRATASALRQLADLIFARLLFGPVPEVCP